MHKSFLDQKITAITLTHELHSTTLSHLTLDITNTHNETRPTHPCDKADHFIATMSTPPSTPPRPKPSFDITAHYKNLLASNPTLTPPIAAIESLISLLSTSPITTVSETLSLISHASTTLLSTQQNPIPVSAGTDLFQRYLITSFQNTPLPSQSGNDFTQLRNQLITNSKVFVARAKSARNKIARNSLNLIRDESIIITYGSSRVVRAALSHAAEAGRWFRIVQIVPASPTASSELNGRIADQVSAWRKAGIEVATVPVSSLSYVLHSLPTSNASAGAVVMLGASAVLENGATVSEMGSYLVAQVAKAHSLPVYVATESYKFARQFPIGYGAKDLKNMGTEQEVLKFSSGSGNNAGEQRGNQGAKDDGHEKEQLVDITPPGLITGLVTENGIMTPNAVAEELIKLWY